MSKIERYLLDMLDKIDECDNYDDIRKCINKTNYFLRDAVIEVLPKMKNTSNPCSCSGIGSNIDCECDFNFGFNEANNKTHKAITELFG